MNAPDPELNQSIANVKGTLRWAVYFFVSTIKGRRGKSIAIVHP